MPLIQSVTAFSVEYPEPNDNNSLRYLTFAKVVDADGVEGWGEAITQFPVAARATEVLIAGMADLLVGRDTADRVALWHELREQGWWYGYRGGLFSFALSAVDIAMWDAYGKARGLSLLELLGGARVPWLRTIASTHAFDADLDAEAERHGRFVHSGAYAGVKIGFGKAGEARLGYELERDVRFVRRLRETCGPAAWIMIDRGHSLRWTLDEAIARVRAFEESGLKWIEEPFEPWQVDEHRALRGRVGCMIAGAEREWDERGYAEAMSSGVLDVIGCDVGRVGGVTGALRVIALVEREQRWFNSHAWSSAINTAVSIALSAATDRTLVQELKPEINPMQHELVPNPIQAAGGRIELLTAPGIGVEPDEHVIRRYALR